MNEFFTQFVEALLGLGIILIITLLYILSAIISSWDESTYIAPPMPEVQYAEFPFEIVYTIDGEVHEIKDSYVCEFDRIIITDEGKKLKWNAYQKSTHNHNIILYEKDDLHRISLYAGSAEYYMMESSDEYMPGEYFLGYMNPDMTAEEAKEEYGVEIISAKFSEPIDNEFEYRTIDKINIFIHNIFDIPEDETLFSVKPPLL